MLTNNPTGPGWLGRIKGLLGSVFNLFALGGATGGIVVRKPVGTPGANESWIYHDSTGLHIICKDSGGAGNVSIVAFNGSQTLTVSSGSISASGNLVALGNAVYTKVGGASGIIHVADGIIAPLLGAAAGGWLQNTAGRKRNTADVTESAGTLTNLTDLSQTYIAGRKYFGFCVVYAKNSVAAEGLQFDFNGGTATMTSFVAGLVGTPIGATVGVASSEALATAMTVTTATTGYTAYLFAVSFVVNAAGTVILRGAENTPTAGTATFRLGSFYMMEDSPN